MSGKRCVGWGKRQTLKSKIRRFKSASSFQIDQLGGDGSTTVGSREDGEGPKRNGGGRLEWRAALL